MNLPLPADNSKNKKEFLLALTAQVSQLAESLLTKFNQKEIKLKDIPPHKRIFLFFLTRTIKTYSAIQTLSREGYGQDTATLIRGLLESLISVRYILADPKIASQRAVRFVEYKWVIFRRYLPDEKEDVKKITDSLRQELIAKKSLILEKIQEFKNKYKITSDRALITWSGRSLRDMAKMVDRILVEEYDSTFRLSSRFSHPSIIGDSEYLNQQDGYLIFYPSPSNIGIADNLKAATHYMLEFIAIFDNLFNLQQTEHIARRRQKAADQFKEEDKIIPKSSHDPSGDSPKSNADGIIIRFHDPSEESTSP